MHIHPVNSGIGRYSPAIKLRRTNNIKDTVSFLGKYTLYKKYDINPDDVSVDTSCGISIDKEEKEELIEKILEAHEHAKKNKLTGNITNSAYATNIKLKNNSWTLGTNFNNTRNNISNFCGERSAIVGAFNKLLSSVSLTRLQNDPNYKKIANQNNIFQVEYLAMSSYKDIGTDKNASSPCADCLSWLNTERFFSDNTKIASLRIDDDSSYTLVIRTIKDYLPYRKEADSLITNEKCLDDLDFTYTNDSKKALKKYNLDEFDILKLIKEAKEQYESNNKTVFSRQNTAASVLDSEGCITSAKKLDWSKRWFVEPLEFAASKALENKPNSAKIIAAAYYGEGTTYDNETLHKDGVVSLQTLGRIKTLNGTLDTLIVTINDNRINIRTIGDYMPEKFSFIQNYLQKAPEQR